jgi:hypothetical protein
VGFGVKIEAVEVNGVVVNGITLKLCGIIYKGLLQISHDLLSGKF